MNEGDDDDDDDEQRPVKKQKKQVESALHSIKWRRVVLDEGHLIKNPKAKMTRACTQLKAECVPRSSCSSRRTVLTFRPRRRRWILSGTPIVNAAADRASLFLSPFFQPASS